jgi:hypothetical protein
LRHLRYIPAVAKHLNFSSFDGEVQTARSPIKQGNPECCFQLLNLPAQGGLRDMERFGCLPKTSSPGDFHEGD